MSRSKWKCIYVQKHQIKKNHLKKNIVSRRCGIPSMALNKQFEVYSGNEFKKLLITRDKLGLKFGTFVFSKKRRGILKSTKKK